MRHPYKRFIKIELFSLILAIMTGLSAIIWTRVIWVILSMYLIAISLLCDGIVAQSTHQHTWAIKQFIRAFLLFILTTLLLFKL